MNRIPKMEIPDLLAAADFGIHVLADVEMFRSSVSPNKVFDYLAAGLPVLTNNEGHVGDAVSTAPANLAVGPTLPGERPARNSCASPQEHRCANAYTDVAPPRQTMSATRQALHALLNAFVPQHSRRSAVISNSSR